MHGIAKDAFLSLHQLGSDDVVDIGGIFPAARAAIDLGLADYPTTIMVG